MAKTTRSADPTGGLNKKDQQLFTEFLKQQVKGQKENLSVQEDLAKAKQDELSFTEKLISHEKEILNLVEKRKKAAQEYNDYARDMSELLKNQSREQKIQSGDLVKEMVIQKKKLKLELDSLDVNKELTVLNKKALEDALKEVQAKKENLEALEKATEKASELVEKYESITEAFEEADEFVKKLPGGELLSKFLGTDKVGDKIKESVTKRLAEGQVAGKGLVASLGPLIPLLIAAGLLMKAFEFDKELTQFSKDLDVSKGSALELSNHADHLATHLGMANITGKEMGASMVALKEEFGDIALSNDKLVEGVTMLRERMGLTNEEAISLNSTATLLGTNLDELSASSMKMSEGLIGGKQMLKEMSKLPKSILVGFKGTTKELQKAVIKGKLFGLELSKAQSIGDGLLDIEQSLEKEMTANVLTGKRMNLNKARQLALEGDISGLQQELLDQAGGLDDYQKMAPYQQKAYAEAMGMTRDEMTEMLVKAQELKDVGLDQAKVEEVLAANGAERDKMMSSMDATQQGYLQKLIEQKNQEEATAKFQTAMNRLMEAFSKSMLPVVNILGEMLGYIGNIVDYLTKGVEYVNHFVHELSGATEPLKEGEGIMSKILKYTIGIGAAMLAWNVGKKALGGLKSMIPGMGGNKATDAISGGGNVDAMSGQADKAKSLADKFKGIADSVKSFFDILRNAVQGIMGIVTDVFKGVGEALAGFFKAFSSISFTDLIKGALALGVMAGALYLMGEALGKFADIGLDDLGIAALALIGLTAAVVGLSYILPMIAMGSLALGIMSAAFWVFGAAAATVADAMPALASGFKLFGDIDGVNLIGVAAGITALSGALALYGAGSALSGIGSAIGALFDEDPVEKFNRFAAIDANKLLTVAGAITALGSALNAFSNSIASIGDVSAFTDAVEEIADSDIAAAAPALATISAAGAGGGTQPAAAGAQQGSMKEVTDLLKQLIAATSQPVKINIGGKVIDEIEKQTTLRKTYNTKMDTAHGAFG